MTATDKVFRQHPTWKHEITTTKDRLDAAISRGAHESATQLAIENAYHKLSFKTVKAIIERCIRAELGLK